MRTTSLIIIGLFLLFVLMSGHSNAVAAADEAICHPLGASTDMALPAAGLDRPGGQTLSNDADADALPDDLETKGWDNAAGHFVSDPVDADSDNDGLTDGEEKLFDSNPNDPQSPGLYVLYTNELKTSKYFGWQRHGNRFIATANAVVRRGASFTVGGPYDAKLSIGTSGGLSNLTVLGTDCSGRWRITVPSGGTVGKYVLTLTKGTWSKSLNLYVIFGLPADLSDADIAANVYSDDPSNTRDDWAIWWLPDDDSVNEAPHSHADHRAQGRGFAFENDQYLSYVFVDHIMSVINGYTDPWAAADTVAHHVDSILRFEGESVPLNMYAALHAYRNQAQCSIHASVLTAFLRGAGIAARPVAIDWDMYNRPQALMDTATELWLSGNWRVMRAWASNEPYPGPMNLGIVPITERSTWGTTRYTDGLGDLMLVADSNWPWDQIQTTWEAPNPLDYSFGNWQRSSIVRWNWVKTQVIPYAWGWPGEPNDIGDPYNVWPSWPSSLPVSAGAPSAPPVRNSTLQQTAAGLGDISGERGVDLNGNGRYDQLVIRVNVSVTQPGGYTIGAALDSADAAVRAQTSRLATASTYVNLQQGLQTVELAFNGQTLFQRMVDGPYRVNSIWIYSGPPDPDPHRSSSDPLQVKNYEYITRSYRAKDFEPLGSATLLDQYQEQATTNRSTGRYATLTISVGFALSGADKYTVMASLYDKQGKLIQDTQWSGSQSPALLKFDQIAGREGPYQLRNLRILDANDQIIDSREIAYTTRQVTSAVGKTQLTAPPGSQQSGSRITVPNQYSDSGVDKDGDGRYDVLAISVGIEVAPEEGGQPYRVEGFLLDKNSALVTYSISNASVLSAGVRTLSLEFDGRIINEHGVDGPLTLGALRVLAGGSYKVLDEIALAYTTASYNHDQFQARLLRPAVNVFADDMENGSGQWTAASPWSLVTNDWVTGAAMHSGSGAWRATSSAPGSGSLTLKMLSLSDYASPVLRFRTCYTFNTSDRGYVEASGDRITWTRVLTLTGESPHWANQVIDLSQWTKSKELYLRFNANSQSGLLWYVDDVYLDAWPAIKSAGWTNNPTPVLAGTDTVFQASYTSLNMTLPITYTWDFGDGTAPVQSSSPQVTHIFQKNGNPTVQLAVESAYDRRVTSQQVRVYQPVALITFSYSPFNPDRGENVMFSANPQPSTADQPITYTWNFGDGSAPVVTTQSTVSHAFPQRNYYNVRLGATNGYGAPVAFSERVGVHLWLYYLPFQPK